MVANARNMYHYLVGVARVQIEEDGGVELGCSGNGESLERAAVEFADRTAGSKAKPSPERHRGTSYFCNGTRERVSVVYVKSSVALHRPSASGSQPVK